MPISSADDGFRGVRTAVLGRAHALAREARGASSAASAANAAIGHVRDWVLGTAEGEFVSVALPSDGSYGVPEGLISSFPVTCKDGKYEIVQGLDLNDFSKKKIAATVDELTKEQGEVREMGLI